MRKHLLLISIIFFSCQKEITLNLPQAENQLVVQGAIENGFPPYVILTNNQGYFEEINSETYTNLFVDDVESIKVWYIDETGLEVSRFLEMLPPNIAESIIGEAIPLYTITELNDLSEIISNTGNYSFSQAGRTYFLEIKWNGKIVSAQTTIPIPTPLDCLWVEQSETAEKDYKCDIRAIYSDPADQQNNILIKSKRTAHYKRLEENSNDVQCEIQNQPDTILKIVDAGSDILINGESFETYFPKPSDNGFPTGQYNSSHNKDCNDTLVEFKNDTVLIKFCQIDEPSMKFWRGLVRQVGTNGNPFAEPMNLVSNINNGLGVWTGYGAVYYQVPIIKETTIIEEYKPELKDIF